MAQEYGDDIFQTDSGYALDLAIRLPKGLHSRPSARLAQTAREFDARILLIADEGEVDAKSMLDVLSLALQRDDKVRIFAAGPEAKEAIKAIAALLEGRE